MADHSLAFWGHTQKCSELWPGIHSHIGAILEIGCLVAACPLPLSGPHPYMGVTPPPHIFGEPPLPKLMIK